MNLPMNLRSLLIAIPLALAVTAAPAQEKIKVGYWTSGFSVGFGVTLDRSQTRLPGSVGEYFWGGAASTASSCRCRTFPAPTSQERSSARASA